jgi:hypothetical protein
MLSTYTYADSHCRPLSIPFKLLGIKITRMNPNLCNICETMFTKIKRKKQLIIPATVFFADLRGYTNLSQGTDSAEVVGMLHEFYDECVQSADYRRLQSDVHREGDRRDEL